MAESSSNVKKGMKRRRTRSHNSSPSPSGAKGFFVPGFDLNSSNKGMSLKDILDTSKGVTNMILAHEIAVNKNFRMEDLKEENPMEQSVKEIVHRAFWDVLNDQLFKNDPPIFDQALSLFGEIKEIILGLLIMPQHEKVKTSIEEKFDVTLVKQQAENGVLDVESYAQYVLNLMGKLCAPVRDEEIAQLKAVKDVIPLFQGIMKTLENMKLDMANYTLAQARPFIVSKSVEYEKEKFKEFIEKQSDGLKSTREWLKRHAPRIEDSDVDRKSAQYKKMMTHRIMMDAATEILEWDEYYNLPETLVMDQKRIWTLRDLTERTSVSTALILLTFSHVGTIVVPAESQKLKINLKQKIDVLLQEFHNDEDLKIKILPNIAEEVVRCVNHHLVNVDKKSELSEELSKNLKEQILTIEDPNQRIRDLVQKRIVEFCKQAISGSRTAPLQVPPGLTICQKELGQIAGTFVQLVSYNRAVFNETYLDIIENHVLFQDSPTTSETRESREA